MTIKYALAIKTLSEALWKLRGLGTIFIGDKEAMEVLQEAVVKLEEQQDKIEYLQNSLDEMTKDRDEWKEKFYEEYSQR